MGSLCRRQKTCTEADVRRLNCFGHGLQKSNNTTVIVGLENLAASPQGQERLRLGESSGLAFDRMGSERSPNRGSSNSLAHQRW